MYFSHPITFELTGYFKMEVKKEKLNGLNEIKKNTRTYSADRKFSYILMK